MFVPPWLRTAGKGAETQVFKNRLTEAEVSPAGPGAAPAARSSGGRPGTALTASLGPALPVQGTTSNLLRDLITNLFSSPHICI